MSFLIAGALVFALAVWLGRRPMLARRSWRYLSAAAAIAAFAGAAFTGIRGAWAATIVLLVVGLWLAASVRRPAARARPPAQGPAQGMSLREARAILGVSEEADEAEIDAAYRRLMRRAHPDVGGTEGLAAQLNAARARLKRSA